MDFNALYYRDPYAKEFDAEVVSCTDEGDHFETVLSDTAFYPEGGGQPADHGTLGGVEVYDVQDEHGKVVHYTKEPVEGPKVHGQIDWARRHDMMQQHSADHIFAGLVHDQYGFENVGFQIGDVTRMDFDGVLTDEQVRDLEVQANKAVWRDVATRVEYPTHAELDAMDFRSKKALKGQVRIVVFPGIDVCACCGTHVARTGEIGLIRIVSCEKHKKGVRVLMLAGDRALDHDLAVDDQNHEVSVLLSAEPEHTADAVRDVLSENESLKKQAEEARMAQLSKRVSEVPDGQACAALFVADVPRPMMVKAADQLLDERHAKVACVFSEGDAGMAYILASNDVDMRSASKEFNKALDGRGGGRPDAVQGVVKADEDAIRAELSKLFEE